MPSFPSRQPGTPVFSDTAVYRGAAASGGKRIWLTTFADLTALMLTFFVLQFSMSKIDEVEWQNLSDSFQTKLTEIRDTEVPIPQDSLTIARQDRIPGDDLDYLGSIVADYLAETGLSEGVVLLVDSDRVRLRLSNRPDDRTIRLLGDLLSRIENQGDIAVAVRPEGAGERQDFARALTAADGLAKRFAALGLNNLSTIRGYLLFEDGIAAGPQGENRGKAAAARVEITIQAHTGER